MKCFKIFLGMELDDVNTKKGVFNRPGVAKAKTAHSRPCCGMDTLMRGWPGLFYKRGDFPEYIPLVPGGHTKNPFVIP